MEYTKLSNISGKSHRYNSATYNAGDIVIVDNHANAALVLQVFAETIKVLLESNLISIIQKSRVSKKIFFK